VPPRDPRRWPGRCPLVEIPAGQMSAADGCSCRRYVWSKNAAQMEHLCQRCRRPAGRPVTSTGSEPKADAPRQQNPLRVRDHGVRRKELHRACLRSPGNRTTARAPGVIVAAASLDGTMAEAQRAARALACLTPSSRAKRTTASGMDLVFRSPVASSSSGRQPLGRPASFRQASGR
jgi:hypothetical protein